MELTQWGQSEDSVNDKEDICDCGIQVYVSKLMCCFLSAEIFRGKYRLHSHKTESAPVGDRSPVFNIYIQVVTAPSPY